MVKNVKRRTLVGRIIAAPSTARKHYRIMCRYANRWDAAVASVRLAWASAYL